MADESPRVKAKTRLAVQDASKYECVSLLSVHEDHPSSKPLHVAVSVATNANADSLAIVFDPATKSVGVGGNANNKTNDLEAAHFNGDSDDKLTPKTSYVAPSTVVFWLSMWFVQNIGVTFWNKKALTAIRLPITLTFVHMVCNTLGASAYIYIYRGVDRKPLKREQQSLMLYFSLIFVSNIITGNMSLGLVSITFNQVMRALVPGVVVILSMVILGKSYSSARKASLLPVAYGVYLACTGDNTYTMFGLFITLVAVIFAGLKVVLSNKFLSGDLKLHPVDLILHQAPLSAVWCLIAMVMSGEWTTLMRHWDDIPTLCVWYLITGVVSFLLNVTSFQANKVTSPVTLCVCGNVKQILVITMSILINHDVITTQKMFGIALVSAGGIAYAVVSNREMNKTTVTMPSRPVVAA